VTTKTQKARTPITGVPTLVQVKGRETLRDLHYIKEVMESQTGLRVSYQNVINLLINSYLKER